ncbi:MAG: SH3 domain-containing protein [Hyphomicrobiaceae bacterium]|nr:SH3 domain-containing protein [Hyphomicrobiaceae bacterium]
MRSLGFVAFVAVALVARSELVAAQSASSGATRTLCVHDIGEGKTLNVRAKPALSAEVVGQLAANTCGLRLVGRCEGDWCQMAAGNVTGWVTTRYVGVYEYPTAAAGAPAAAARGARPTEGATAVAADPKPSGSSPAAKPPASVAGGRDASMSGSLPSPALKAPSSAAGRSRSALEAPAARRGMIPHKGLSGSNCVVGVARWDTLRIRRGPGAGHEEIGAIPAGACRVEQVGGCQGRWCRIAWRGHIGWVNTYYLD